MELPPERATRPGLIPVALDALARTALWLDLNGYHCHEGFFHQTLAAYRALRGKEPWQCFSSLDFLRSPPPVADCIPPTAFIFHAGRCGSTLLARVIARSSAHLVFSEAAPHNQIWRIIAECGDAGTAMYRNLLLHMGRRRLPSWRAHIVKFTSFNIVRFAAIRSAFPDVPALFLFRDPARILASYHRESPAWMGRDTGIGTVWDNAETALEDFFRAALSIRDPQLRCLDYAGLTPESLPAILRFFQLDPPATDLAAMRAEFHWDAKSGSRPRSYRAVARPLGDTAPDGLQKLWTDLRSRQSAADRL